jgi:hypothetical protein
MGILNQNKGYIPAKNTHREHLLLVTTILTNQRILAITQI